MGILVILAAILKDDVISTCVDHFRDVHPGFSYTLDHPLLISGESCRGPHNSTGFLPAAPLIVIRQVFSLLKPSDGNMRYCHREIARFQRIFNF